MADKKPRGYIEKLLIVDAETSGLAYNEDDPSYDSVTQKEYQAVSWGFVVASAITLKPIEELYVEVKWNGESEWSKEAERVHGLSLKHLEANGVSSEEAALMIGKLILKYWGPDSPVTLCGHNVMTFDAWFLKRQLRRHGLNKIKFGSKNVDTNAIGFAAWQTHNSDDLFAAVGLPERDATKHNSLDDARSCLQVLRVTRGIFQQCLDGK